MDIYQTIINKRLIELTKKNNIKPIMDDRGVIEAMPTPRGYYTGVDPNEPDQSTNTVQPKNNTPEPTEELVTPRSYYTENTPPTTPTPPAKDQSSIFDIFSQPTEEVNPNVIGTPIPTEDNEPPKKYEYPFELRRNFPTWYDVVIKDDFQNASESDKDKIREAYLRYNILSKTPEKYQDAIREEFYKDSESIERNARIVYKAKDIAEKAISKVYGVGKRAVGIGVGVLNAPNAFLWGAATEYEKQDNKNKHIEKTGIEKLKSQMQELGEVLKAGTKAAVDSAFHKGKWGPNFTDYYQEREGHPITDEFGDTIKNNPILRESINLIVNTIADPLVVMPVASSLSSIKSGDKAVTMLRKLASKLPEGSEKDAYIQALEEISKLSPEEKRKLVPAIRKVYKLRSKAIKKINNTIDKVEKKPDYFTEFNSKESKISKEVKDFIKKDDELFKELQDLHKKGATKKELSLKEKEIIEHQKPIIKNNISSAAHKYEVLTKKKVDVEKLHNIVDSADNANNLFRLRFVNTEKGIKRLIQDYNLSDDEAKLLIASLKESQNTIRELQESTQGKSVKYKIPKGNVDIGDVGVVAPVTKSKLNRALKVLKDTDELLLDRFTNLKKTAPKAYKEARIYESAKDRSYIYAKNLVDGIKKQGINLKKDKEFVDLDNYIKLKRDLVRYRNKKLNPGDLSPDEIIEKLEKIKTYYNKKGVDIDKAAEYFNKWTQEHMLDQLYKNGFINDESYKKIKETNDFYSSYKVAEKVLDEGGGFPTSRSLSPGKQTATKGVEGTTKEILSPFKSTIEKQYQIEDLIAKNNVTKGLRDSLANSGKTLRPVASSKKSFNLLKKQGLDPIMEGKWDKNSYDVMHVWEDGIKKTYLIDKDIAKIIKGLDPSTANALIKASNILFKKTATTLNIGFSVSNFWRDFLMAFNTSEVYKTKDLLKFIRDWGKGAYHGAAYAVKPNSKAAKIVKEYLKAGGGQGYTGSVHKDILKDLGKSGENFIWKLVKSPAKNAIKAVEKFNETIEFAPRLAVYNKALKLGYSKKEAAFLARESTIDFNRMGSKMQQLNQWVPFVNARTQSLIKYAEAMKRDPKGTFSKMLITEVTPQILLEAWNRTYYPELYEMVPDNTKQKYNVMVIGSEFDEKRNSVVPKLLLYPKDEGGIIVGGLTTAAINVLSKDNPKKTNKELFDLMFNLLPIQVTNVKGKVSPGVALENIPLVKVVIDPISNKNFYLDRQIIPDFMKNRKPEDQYYPNKTPDFYVKLSKVLSKSGIHVSPLHLQAGASATATVFGQQGFSPNGLLENLTGRFYRKQGGQIYYNANADIQQIDNTYKTIQSTAKIMARDGDIEAARKLMTDWNKQVIKLKKNYDKTYSKYKINNYKDNGYILSSYYFTQRKIMSTILAGKKLRADINTPTNRLQKKLNPTRTQKSLGKFQKKTIR